MMVLPYHLQFPSATPIEDLDTSKALRKQIENSNIKKLGDFKGKNYKELKSAIPRFTKKSWNEVQELLSIHGLLKE